jgi:hypothetical protein
VKFQVLKAARKSITAFWDIAPCSLVELDQHFIPLMMEALSTCETSGYFFAILKRQSFILIVNVSDDSATYCVFFCFIHRLDVIKTTFRKLVVLTSSGERRTRANLLCHMILIDDGLSSNNKFAL